MTATLITIVIIIFLLILCAVYWHQYLLRDRAGLMRDAMRHRDFSFRLPTRGLLFGERALQELLNDMGEDIRKLVAQKEAESWQRLTRVLTHEIMNATAPIQSITQAYLANPHIKGSVYEEGIKAIHDTTAGLSHFIDNYRRLTLLQDPILKDFSLQTFCNTLPTLHPHIQWDIEVPSDIIIHADEHQLRQVFSNLIKNAIEADAKCIGIRHIPHPQADRRQAPTFYKLLISNDGHVIPDEVAREIFIPFFTTKPQGSGIGLSLSRQMLMMQGLSLSLREHPIKGYNVTFEMENDSI